MESNFLKMKGFFSILNRCWRGCGRKRYTHTLLVGLQISAATLESSVEIPQKAWNGTTI